MSLPQTHLRLPAAQRPPLAIAEARCNRCGGCLKVACPAIGYAGGEALEIDEVTCTGCGLCVPLCRGRAIGPALRVMGSIAPSAIPFPE